MESEKNNKGLIIALVIAIMLAVGFGGFIVYDKFIKEDAKKADKKDEKEETKEEAKDEGKEESPNKEDIKYDNLIGNDTYGIVMIDPEEHGVGSGVNIYLVETGEVIFKNVVFDGYAAYGDVLVVYDVPNKTAYRYRDGKEINKDTGDNIVGYYGSYLVTFDDYTYTFTDKDSSRIFKIEITDEVYRGLGIGDSYAPYSTGYNHLDNNTDNELKIILGPCCGGGAMYKYNLDTDEAILESFSPYQ